MRLYLAGSTHPDIAYAVCQCVSFSHKPRLSHEVGSKHIGRYLKGTRMIGISMQPDTAHMNMNLYADTNFAELFTAEDKSDPISVKSQIGILLCFGNIPIFWIQAVILDSIVDFGGRIYCSIPMYEGISVWSKPSN